MIVLEHRANSVMPKVGEIWEVPKKCRPSVLLFVECLRFQADVRVLERSKEATSQVAMADLDSKDSVFQ